ncbi:hypothetical protein ACNF49_39780 [Actinomadura sp. ATCC 39365]
MNPDERIHLDAEQAYDAQDGGYSAIMRTRPDTIAAALTDSPAGLLAWIADKYRDWSDCEGDLKARWEADDLLTLSHESLMAGFPRSLAERAFPNLRHFARPDRGGHFMAHEEPDYLAEQLRTFFRPLT